SLGAAGSYAHRSIATESSTLSVGGRPPDSIGQTALGGAVFFEAAFRLPYRLGAFVRVDGLDAMYRPGDTVSLFDDQTWNAVVTSLAGRGADVNAMDQFGATPLHRAAGFGRILLVRTLLALSSDANARDANDRTPLFWAVEAGNAQIVVHLFREQADANAADRDGRTALHFAAMYNRWDIAPILIERGAQVTARDVAGLTPTEYAAREGDERKVTLLDQYDTE
ncbi:MAG: ankyrin repeat domain-containing protein, partial [bacterium]|nr:ankyrin repeat domain-containing protein [Candidatus Kapabacteria bacterium]